MPSPVASQSESKSESGLSAFVSTVEENGSAFSSLQPGAKRTRTIFPPAYGTRRCRSTNSSRPTVLPTSPVISGSATPFPRRSIGLLLETIVVTTKSNSANVKAR